LQGVATILLIGDGCRSTFLTCEILIGALAFSFKGGFEEPVGISFK
jgi:hypothetical protein